VGRILFNHAGGVETMRAAKEGLYENERGEPSWIGCRWIRERRSTQRASTLAVEDGDFVLFLKQQQKS